MRKLVLSLTVAAAALLSLGGAAWATNGMQVIGTGPVARSMGGATTAMPLDSSVIMHNPAAMSELDGRVDFGVTYFVPSSKYKAYDVTPGIGGGRIAEKDSDTGPSPMPAFGLIIPINDKVRFGVGAYGLAGMGVDYTSGLYTNVTYTKFQMMKFAPALSYKINDKFSVGAALNLDYATLSFNAGRSMTTGAIVSHDDNSQFGYGFEVGAFYKANQWLQFALSYVSRQEFPDFSFHTVYGDDKLNFDLPQNVTFGVGLNITPKLKVAFDLKWINWKDTMGDNKPEWSQVPSGSGAWNCGWDDQIVYAIGAQYAVTNTVRLRAGFNYAKNPLPESRAFEGIAFPAIVETHYTAGVGWDITPKVELNLGVMYAPSVTMSGSNTSQGIMSYETSLSEYSLEFGLAYKF